MRTLSRKSFAIGLLVALLVTYTGRAVPVSALADPVEAVSPVFDTQIYQLQDYIENGGLTDPQLDIFYILSGALISVGFAGASEYELNDPYTTQDGVEGWLKSCGIQLYNTLVDMNMIGVDPNTGIDLRKVTSPLADMLFGVTQKAMEYESLAAFNTDLAGRNDFYIPLTADVQASLNTMMGYNGGLYYWQQTEGQYTSPFTWRQYTMNNVQSASYNEYLNDITLPRAFCNSSYGSYYNSITHLWQHFDLFIDTDQYIMQLYDENGEALNGSWYTLPKVLNFSHFVDSFGNPYDSVIYQYNMNAFCQTISYEPANFNTFAEVAQYGYNNFNSLFYMRDQSYNSYYYYFDPLAFINKVYYGVDWASRSEVIYTTDLNFEQNSNQYYNQVQEHYLLDIKGLLGDLLNTTNLYLPFINNLVNPDGDVGFIKVSVELQLPDEYYTPPIPVNMNDIAELTDNSYLERIKEEAKRGGNALAYLVAFLHNCDAEIVYIMFGAGITILVGAFIGKWGHS